jgi:hypothetical protein
MNCKGQALIEVATFFMALSVLLGGLCGFTKWIIVREKLLLAAKQGAFLYSSGHMTRAEVENSMRQFLIGGTPPLNPDGIYVSVHSRGTALSWADRYWQIDESVAQYTPPGGWNYLLGAEATMKETCVIKHAPHYWDPILRVAGPAVPYGG